MNAKKFISEDHIINKAVQDAIDDFMKPFEKTKIVSPRIDDEIPNVSKYVRTFSNISSFDKDGSMLDEAVGDVTSLT